MAHAFCLIRVLTWSSDHKIGYKDMKTLKSEFLFSIEHILFWV